MQADGRAADAGAAPTPRRWRCATPALAAAQLHELAERAARRNLRIGFEALAWGRHVDRYGQAWDIVERADHPHLGPDPRQLPHAVAGATIRPASPTSPARRSSSCRWPTRRCWRWTCCSGRATTAAFPGQGQFDVVNFFEQVLLCRLHRPAVAGDLQRRVPRDAEPPHRRRRDALAAVTSKSQVRDRLRSAPARRRRAAARSRIVERIELFDAPAMPALRRLAFVEFARRRGGGRGARRAAAAAGLSPHRPAPLEGGRCCTARATSTSSSTCSRIRSRARRFDEHGPSRVRARPAHRRPDARRQPRHRAAVGALRQPDRPATSSRCRRSSRRAATWSTSCPRRSARDGLFEARFRRRRRRRRDGDGEDAGLRAIDHVALGLAQRPARHLGAVLPRRARPASRATAWSSPTRSA